MTDSTPATTGQIFHCLRKEKKKEKSKKLKCMTLSLLTALSAEPHGSMDVQRVDDRRGVRATAAVPE